MPFFLLVLISYFIIPPFVAFLCYTNWNLIRARRWSLFNAGFLVLTAIIAPAIGAGAAYGSIVIWPVLAPTIFVPTIAIGAGSLAAAFMLTLATRSLYVLCAIVLAGTASAGASVAIPFFLYVVGDYTLGGYILGLFGAMIVWHTIAIIMLKRWSTRIEEATKDLCSVCSYDLSGITSGACPECGTGIAAVDASEDGS